MPVVQSSKQVNASGMEQQLNVVETTVGFQSDSHSQVLVSIWML